MSEQKPINLLITLGGGLIDSIQTDTGTPIKVTIVDYDVEGLSGDKITMVPDRDGDQSVDAFVITWGLAGVELDRVRVQTVLNAIEEQDRLVNELLEDWKDEVSNGNTRLGFEDWKANRKEQQ